LRAAQSTSPGAPLGAGKVSIMTLFSKLGSYDFGTYGSGPLHLSSKDG
jgi:hypothetical protein